MARKAEILKNLERLPDDATTQDFIDRLYFLLHLERGVPLYDAGEVVRRADVMERAKKLAESATVDDLMDHLTSSTRSGELWRRRRPGTRCRRKKLESA
jgi:hypothetical protein